MVSGSTWVIFAAGMVSRSANTLWLPGANEDPCVRCTEGPGIAQNVNAQTYSQASKGDDGGAGNTWPSQTAAQHSGSLLGDNLIC